MTPPGESLLPLLFWLTVGQGSTTLPYAFAWTREGIPESSPLQGTSQVTARFQAELDLCSATLNSSSSLTNQSVTIASTTQAEECADSKWEFLEFESKGENVCLVVMNSHGLIYRLYLVTKNENFGLILLYLPLCTVQQKPAQKSQANFTDAFS